MLTLVRPSESLSPIQEYDAYTAKFDFKQFLQLAWHVIEPGKPFVPGWHLDAIADHLTAVSRGDIKRLLVNMPPRHGKSSLISVLWSTWLLLNTPSIRLLCGSYAMNLATRDNLKSRRLIKSTWFQERYGHLFTLIRDQDAKTKFETDSFGYRMAVSVGSSATGEGGDVLILDDPHNIDEKESDAKRATAIDWFDTTWSTRLNDQQAGAMVVVGHRIHQEDVSGHILATNDGEWIHLNLPAEYEPASPCRTVLSAQRTAFWTDPRTDEGELLWKARFPESVIEKAKRRHGPLGYSALFQQQPVPPGGYVFKQEHERLFTIDRQSGAYLLHTPDGLRPVRMDSCSIWITSDVAAKAKEQNDFTVFCVWAVTPRKEVLLLHLYRAHLTIPKQVEEGYKLYLAWVDGRFQAFWCEDVAYQSALGQFLVEKGVPCLEFHPQGHGDKVLRAGGASIWMQLGNVYFLAGASWLEDLRSELYTFPKAAHDDQCILPDTLLPYISHDDIMKTDKYHHEGEKAMLLGEAQNLHEGDLVLTHTGNWQRIVQVITRPYHGEMVAIKPQGGFELVLTPEHPVYCVKRTGQGEFYKPRAVGQPKWIPASEVTVGDSVLEAIDQTVELIRDIDLANYLISERAEAQGKRNNAGLHLSQLILEDDVIRFNNPRSHPIKRIVKVDGDLCRLLGYYVAEGSRGKHNIAWSFHEKETAYHADVTSVLQEKFGITPSFQIRDNSKVLSVSSLILHDFFAQFGRGAKNKVVPQWILHLPHQLQIEFIKGAWRGDGCVASNGSGLLYASSSRELVVALRMMLYRFGIVPSMGISRPNGTYGGSIRGKAIGYSSPLYMLMVGGEYAPMFASLIDMPIDRKHIKNGYVKDRIVDGYVHRRVSRVELRDYEGPVYNFEVEEDHSYQTESFVVHNCDNVSMICIVVKQGVAIEAMDSETTQALAEFMG